MVDVNRRRDLDVTFRFRTKIMPATLKNVVVEDGFTLAESRATKRSRIKSEKDKVPFQIVEPSNVLDLVDQSKVEDLIKHGILKFDPQQRGENTCGLKMINNATQSPGLVEMEHGQAVIKVLKELADEHPNRLEACELLLKSGPLGDDTGNFHVSVLEVLCEIFVGKDTFKFVKPADIPKVFEENFNLCGHFGDGLGHWAAIAVYIGCNTDYMSVWKLDSIREPILLSDPKKPPDRMAASKLAESVASTSTANAFFAVVADDEAIEKARRNRKTKGWFEKALQDYKAAALATAKAAAEKAEQAADEKAAAADKAADEKLAAADETAADEAADKKMAAVDEAAAAVEKMVAANKAAAAVEAADEAAAAVEVVAIDAADEKMTAAAEADEAAAAAEADEAAAAVVCAVAVKAADEAAADEKMAAAAEADEAAAAVEAADEAEADEKMAAAADEEAAIKAEAVEGLEAEAVEAAAVKAAAVKAATVKEELTLDSSEEVKPPGTRAHTLLPLTDEQAEKVDEALRPGDPDEILAELLKIPISRLDMATLRPGQWLNDEVINFFLKLLEQREVEATWPSCHFHQTTFYPKLAEEPAGYKYSHVAEWTRGKDVFSKDLIMVPIHRPGHWTLAVINMKQQRFEYYDSLRGPPGFVFENLRRWLEDESLDKKGVSLDTTGWTEVVWKQGQTPQQRNSWDCGMFLIRTADWLARGAVLSFTQEDMEHLRRLTVLEILEGSEQRRTEGWQPGDEKLLTVLEILEGSEQRRTEGWQLGDEKLQAATVNGVIETIMSETLKSEREIMSGMLWEAAVALQSSLGADPHVPPQLLLVPSVDGVAKLGGNGGKADGRLVIFLVLGTTTNPAWTANNINYKFLGKMRVDPHASKRSKVRHPLRPLHQPLQCPSHLPPPHALCFALAFV